MVFVPSRGFLFFYWNEAIWNLWKLFSSPHGDFSFSILKEALKNKEYDSFRPLTGISLFLSLPTECWSSPVRFSSPHGDFSFSINKPSLNLVASSVFVPSRGFLFFYKKLLNDCYVKGCFRPLTGISLFLSVADMYDMAGLSFSSPHGDFSFSIEKRSWTATRRQSFRPLTGISLFL